MAFFRTADLPGVEMLPGVTRRAVWLEGVMMTFFEFEPGSTVPEHSHPHEQIGTCLEGKGVMTSAGEACNIVKGSTWTIPGEEEHMFEALDEPVLVLEVWSPPREDYRKLAE